MKKILLAPNSFKECSNSIDASRSLRKILAKSENLLLEELPISDGGDGFLDVCSRNFNLDILTYEVKRPYTNNLTKIRTGYLAREKTLYIESAEVIGLKYIPADKRCPSILNTKGLGDLFKSIIESELNVDKIVLGVGGTGTSDLGLGLCSAFGLKLYDNFGKETGIIPENYYSVSSFKWESVQLPFTIEVIVDVDNPLLGEKGAIKTFAVQKGANKKELEVLELGFEKLINLFYNKGLISSSKNLNGAGGGLAAGLQVFFDAEIVKSKELITNMFLKKLKSFAPDFVITGEGSFDKQSLMDKGASVIIDICKSQNIPVFLVCGRIDEDLLRDYSHKVIPIELQFFFKNERESIENFQKGLEFATEKVISYLSGP